MDVAGFVVKARSDTVIVTKRHRLWQLCDQARRSLCCTPARVHRLGKLSANFADICDCLRARPDLWSGIKPIPIGPAALELALLRIFPEVLLCVWRDPLDASRGKDSRCIRTFLAFVRARRRWRHRQLRGRCFALRDLHRAFYPPSLIRKRGKVLGAARRRPSRLSRPFFGLISCLHLRPLE